MSGQPFDPGAGSQEPNATPFPRLGRLQRLSLAAILSARHSGLTAIEAAVAIGLDRYSVQSRLSELRNKGLIVDSGQRRPNPSGRRAIVWIAREYADVDNEASQH